MVLEKAAVAPCPVDRGARDAPPMLGVSVRSDRLSVRSTSASAASKTAEPQPSSFSAKAPSCSKKPQTHSANSTACERRFWTKVKPLSSCHGLRLLLTALTAAT